MAYEVPTSLYYSIIGKLNDIKHLLKQEKGGCPYDPRAIDIALQSILEGDLKSTFPFEWGRIEVPEFPLEVDFDMSIKELVMLGEYDWHSPNIAQDLPKEQRRGKAKIIIELVSFDREIESARLSSWEGMKIFRPITIHELLTFGIRHPRLQCEFPIIALGSIWTGRNGASFAQILDSSESREQRILDLIHVRRKWDKTCRFAFVRK